MMDISRIDYAILDRPEILMFLFHPRPEWSGQSPREGVEDMLIPVDTDTALGCRVHIAGKGAPTILFFHGNGEIVADYDDMGPLYRRIGVNFMPVDYRGYGRSSGKPTITSMMRDCHLVFDFAQQWLDEKGFSGPFLLMGRSLGSASVLELAAHYQSRCDGLIIESGFAFAGPLFELLGVNLAALGFKEEAGFRNVDKIRDFRKPTLIIHAEQDHIIPFSDGQALYDACQSDDKVLLKIPGANHNDIFLRGISEYMAAVKTLVEKTL